jgi:uncharacterized protein (DUF2062 family)
MAAMSAHHHHHHHGHRRVPLHPAQVRRAKLWLRFVPRRAVFHTYPFIGRFAAHVRQRAYLWSFKPAYVRPALYAGSILSLLPVMGVQLPLALALSLALRANFMVFGGLQFITNPVTAAPIYYGTHQLGAAVMKAAGFHPASVPNALRDIEVHEGNHSAEAGPAAPPPREVRLGRRVTFAVNALTVGGVISGALLGLVLDLLLRVFWRSGRRPGEPPPAAPDGGGSGAFSA